MTNDKQKPIEQVRITLSVPDLTVALIEAGCEVELEGGSAQAKLEGMRSAEFPSLDTDDFARMAVAAVAYFTAQSEHARRRFLRGDGEDGEGTKMH